MRRIAMRGKLLLLVVVVASLGTTGIGGQSVRQSETAKRFIGTWRLVSITGGTAAMAANRGAHPTGLIIYDATGHMAVQIMPDRVRPKYAGTLPTPDEARAAIIGYTAYFGTYTIDEQAMTVTHHHEGNISPGGATTDGVRRYEFAPGDRVILTPLENPQDPPSHLAWERVK
jgi:hypothetical protein